MGTENFTEQGQYYSHTDVSYTCSEDPTFTFGISVLEHRRRDLPDGSSQRVS